MLETMFPRPKMAFFFFFWCNTRYDRSFCLDAPALLPPHCQTPAHPSRPSSNAASTVKPSEIPPGQMNLSPELAQPSIAQVTGTRVLAPLPPGLWAAWPERPRLHVVAFLFRRGPCHSAVLGARLGAHLFLPCMKHNSTSQAFFFYRL